MTIAVIFRTPEGVVLGADSAITYLRGPSGQAYMNHAQKVFQVDDAGTLGVITYGNSGLGTVSYRTIIARLGDRFRDDATRPPTVAEAATQFRDLLLAGAQVGFAAEMAQADAARQRQAAGAQLAPEEQQLLQDVAAFSAGFYVAGRNCSDRSPAAYSIELRLVGPPIAPREHPTGWSMGGATELPMRLLKGWNESVVAAVMSSTNPHGVSRWSGSTEADLRAVLVPLELVVNTAMPIREAVDFVHFIVTMTAKMTKFAQLPPSVGGPAEVAVITSDRPLRWVRHKTFDAAF